MYLNVYRPSVVQRMNGRAIGGLVDAMFNDAWNLASDSRGVAHARLDVLEKGDNYEALVDLPGVNKDDIEINIEGTHVSIKAEVKSSHTAAEGERVIVAQRQVQTYVRSFDLPLEVNHELAEASYENGVLKLVLPKKAVAQAKRIAIK